MGVLKFDGFGEFTCGEIYNNMVFPHRRLTTGIAYSFDYEVADDLNKGVMSSLGANNLEIQGYIPFAARIAGGAYGYTDEYLLIEVGVPNNNDNVRLFAEGFYAVLHCGPSTYYWDEINSKKIASVHETVEDYWRKTYGDQSGSLLGDVQHRRNLHIVSQQISSNIFFNEVKAISLDKASEFSRRQINLQQLIKSYEPNNFGTETLLPSRSFLLQRNPELTEIELDLIYKVNRIRNEP